MLKAKDADVISHKVTYDVISFYITRKLMKIDERTP